MSGAWRPRAVGWSAPIVAAGLAACGSVGLDPTRHTDDSAGPVTISEVDPSFGPVEGGNVVTIIGTGFDGASSVAFGRADPVSASLIDTDTISVLAPYSGVEATVDLTVTSSLGSATRTGGYRFGDEPPDTGDDTGSGNGGNGGDSGGDGVAGLVEFSFLQIACPGCFGLTSELEVTAAAAFHDPVRGSWVSWMPPVGSCTNSAATTALADSYLDAGSYVYLQSGSHSIGMVKIQRDGGPGYEAAGLSNDDYARTASYTVSIPGGPDVDAEEVTGALLTPQGFTSVTPEEAIYTDSRDAFSARVSRNGQAFTWAPFGGTGSFVILIEAYDARSGSPIGEGLCTGADNGSMTVPSSVLGAWPSGSLLAIYFLRYQVETPELASGATLEAVARVGVLGTGVIQ